MGSRLVLGIAASVTALLAGMVVPPAVAAAPSTRHRLVLVDGLNASPARTFDAANVFARWPLGLPQAMGPRFEVTRRVTLTEVGGFLNANADNYGGSTAAPYTVEIRRAAPDGRPSLGAPIAVRAVSDDRNARVWRYESARFHLELRPGVYYALVTARAPATFVDVRPDGVLAAWGLAADGGYRYEPAETTIGFVHYGNESSETFPVHGGPFRVVALAGWRP